MVSPYKKKRDKKGRETNDQLGVKEKTGTRKQKVYKPLSTKKFYLDIKNSAALSKLETKLKSLGATIEQFLVKEVSYVVTDRKDSLSESRPSASCSTPASPSPSPSPSVGVSSPLDGLGQKKTRSRAEAMLERVRLQPQSVKIDPLDNARNWNIPIYSVQEIWHRLEKISAKVSHSSHSTAPGLKVLRGHYLKLETGPGRRPEFKELRHWPNVDLDSAQGESPFIRPLDGSQRMTRKATKDGTERLAHGFCEMCCVEYPDIKTHVLTPRHLKFVNDTENYAELDNLIKCKTIDSFLTSQMCASIGGRRCLRGGSVEKVMGSRNSSLSQSNGQLLPRTRATTRSLDDSYTKKPLEVHCNGIVNHNHLTRSAVKSDSVLGRELGLELEGISRRTRTISASCPATNTEYSQLSPTGSDSTHHLRSRKQIWLPTSLLGTTAEDALNNSRLRPNREYPVAEALKSPTSVKSMKSPSLPPEEASEKKSKAKEENDTSHSKSSPMLNNDVGKGSQQESSEEEDISEKKTKNNENMKLKKVNSKKKFKKKIPQELASLNHNDKRKKIQRKRLSVEEKLIEDNRTYYKVEVLNSKLRSTGYYISQSQRELEMSKANGNEGCVIQNCAEPVKSEVKSEEKEPVVVRFKKVRKTELTLLSDEAESFMFGEPSRRESSVSTVSSEEDDDEVSLKMEPDEQDRIVTKIKREVLDESSIGSCSITSSSTSSRRKRKNADESIIQDNIDYYKLESSSSRLRLQSALFPSTPISIKTEPTSETKPGSSLKVKLDESNFGPESTVSTGKSQENIGPKPSYEDLEFSFESVPTHESWYQVFKRQDECNEIYYPRYSQYPKILLPYEYPSSVLRQFKVDALKEKVGKRKKRKEAKLQQLIIDDKPRKSPRCHASTLAIMSSLKRRRPRDSPEKKSDPVSEISLPPCEMIVQDEESRCSTIIEPPSVAPSDTQMSSGQTVLIPEIRIDTKPDYSTQQKKIEEEIKKAEEDIDNLFSEMCMENEEDVLSHLIYSIKKEVDSSPTKDSPKKGKGKNKSVSKRDKPEEFPDVTTCLPVDPEVFDEVVPESNLSEGPIVDVLNLIDTYRGCSSMERADYEHLNPHAVDALRVLIAESCNSSDCGGSSACCDYSFLGEDGRVCKKRKRKKRNMTGWPAKKKFPKKGEELSTVVLRRNCKARGKFSQVEPSKDSQSDVADETEDDVKKEPCELSVTRDQTNEESDMKLDSKPCSSISRTPSIDSSSTKSFDVQSCCVRVKKMTDNCVESFSRHLRSSDSSPNSSSRRGSSRQAKILGRESLRRCR
ncbi:protein chiffon-like isoform X1 [Macrosteles quadrilineatus]|uniref:protein chiffon-like isoform X1 n=3 Tax=Macrosteles quadrilineatus TaxID=74068 RepID=UPI0023E0F624|nr:protein chiffon-like isoform X1 [Macrosteles quadrilineatus]